MVVIIIGDFKLLLTLYKVMVKENMENHQVSIIMIIILFLISYDSDVTRRYGKLTIVISMEIRVAK